MAAPRKGPVGPATVGHRVDLAVLAPRPAGGGDDQVYVCCAKPLRFEGVELVEGVEVPGAAKWPRLEAWIGARRVRALRPNEEYTTYADFSAALQAAAAAAEEGEAPAETESEETEAPKEPASQE
jgi:hypothetical protein